LIVVLTIKNLSLPPLVATRCKVVQSQIVFERADGRVQQCALAARRRPRERH
jgi:hypothetical protein